tara:strand:+ start:640 stop:1296 length:657 start_codon:yes stop_codon:yes gene_type:complete
MLYIYCAGSYSTEIHDLVGRINFNIDNIIYVDQNRSSNTSIYPHEVITPSKLEKRWTPNDKIVIASGDPKIKSEIYESLVKSKIYPSTIIDPTAIISPSTKYDVGLIAMQFCSISSFTSISKNVTININSNIGHHTKIGSNCFISPMVNIGGNVTIGDNVFIGMGAMIKEGVSIGDSSIISMGSIVYKDIPSSVVAIGNPARVYLKSNKTNIFKHNKK